MSSTSVTESTIHEIIGWGGEILVRGLSREQFFQLASHHPELRMERESNGNILIMTPVKGGSGFRENNLAYYLTDWCKRRQSGMVFSPSTGFDLPDGSIKSPDVAWISQEKLAQLTPEQLEEEFVKVVPDFIVELRSQSDPLAKLQDKIATTWIVNGVRLAWLIDPYGERVYVYRPEGGPEVIDGFDRDISGENVLPGFRMGLQEFKLLNK